MLHDVEDIAETWADTGLLIDCPDQVNTAILLETQKYINDAADDETFQRVTIPVILSVTKQKPSMFWGLVHFRDCKDVYRLGELMNAGDDYIIRNLIDRIMRLDLDWRYFGGLVIQNDVVYLVVEEMDDV